MITRRSFLFTASAALVKGAETSSIIAETAYGKIRGTEVNGIRIFKGVPYGASTTEKNRFMPPVNPASWTGVRDALQYGSSAPQTAAMKGESEDCLVLNVWTPALKDGRKRPVMFWCHGGGFASGSGSTPGTDGTNLAHRGDVVVVSINHRLNVLGFTYASDLSSVSGEAGMLDIVQALKWVRDNIEQFGGDPNNVTIFGQSGGGRKVGTLLSMPPAKGLFHRAIIESGPTIKLVERSSASRNVDRLMAKLGIGKNEQGELQKVPVERIMAAYFDVLKDMGSADQMTEGFSPMVDGSAIPMHPFFPAASSVSADIPLMIGSTRTEMTLQSPADAFSLNEDTMRDRVKTLIGNKTDNTIEAYRKANPGSTPSDIYFLIASDYRYGAPVMKIAERRAALNKGPVYLYYFRWETPVQGGRLKSPHTIEIPFAFDNVKISAAMTGGGAEAMALADRVSDTWLAFARTGDPNNSKIPHWPKFEPKDWPTMVFNNTIKAENDPIHAQRMAMFDATAS
ncbi:MAG TPA: carboxylesterase/lipase family protein [Bryobacteraceae bacterium]|nr:carboxylesterase/lipase family protein [Bryobacteraceae bacterium]